MKVLNMQTRGISIFLLFFFLKQFERDRGKENQFIYFASIKRQTLKQIIIIVVRIERLLRSTFDFYLYFLVLVSYLFTQTM